MTGQGPLTVDKMQQFHSAAQRFAAIVAIAQELADLRVSLDPDPLATPPEVIAALDGAVTCTRAVSILFTKALWVAAPEAFPDNNTPDQ